MAILFENAAQRRCFFAVIREQKTMVIQELTGSQLLLVFLLKRQQKYGINEMNKSVAILHSEPYNVRQIKQRD